MPSREKLRASRSLRWLGPLLERAWRWRLGRRSVARGAALVSNPRTYGPIWVLAYRSGAWLLGEAPDAAQEAAMARLRRRRR